MAAEDYEAAANHIASYLSLESRLQHSALSTFSATSSVDEATLAAQRSQLMEAKAKLEAVVANRFAGEHKALLLCLISSSSHSPCHPLPCTSLPALADQILPQETAWQLDPTR